MSFGFSVRRQALLVGLLAALRELAAAGCPCVYLDGSFTTSKQEPDDYDGAWEETGVDWDLLDPVLLDFSSRRAAQKQKYLGELFPSGSPADIQGRVFLEFFQLTRQGHRKGIVAVELTSLPTNP